MRAAILLSPLRIHVPPISRVARSCIESGIWRLAPGCGWRVSNNSALMASEDPEKDNLKHLISAGRNRSTVQG